MLQKRQPKTRKHQKANAINDTVEQCISDASQVTPEQMKQLGLFSWIQILAKQPTVIEHCPQHIINNFTTVLWVWLLSHQPSLKELCSLYNSFSSEDWAFLLLSQGDTFREEYLAWERSTTEHLTGNSWKHILIRFPQLIDVCDVTRLSKDDVEDIIAMHPSMVHLKMILI